MRKNIIINSLIFILAILMISCSSTSKSSIEKSLAYFYEVDAGDQTYSKIRRYEDNILEYILEKAGKHSIEYDFNPDIFMTTFNDGGSLRMIIWLNTKDESEDGCSNCEMLFEDIKTDFTSMIEVDLVITLNINFGPYSTENYTYSNETD